MKIIVTGGMGFIGSNLVRRLVSAGHDVVVIDNLFNCSITNRVDGVRYVIAPTSDIWLVRDFSPDVIFHLGEYSRVEQSFDDIKDVFELNVVSTFAVIDYSLRNNAKLIYAGSSTVLGDDGAALSPYSFFKQQNIDLIKNYGRWFGLRYAITYFYNVYGPGESSGAYGTVIAKFLDRHRRGEPLQVTEPGTQKRNFTHVDDIVTGLMLVMDDGVGNGFGIGSDESYSIIDVAKMISDKIEITPGRQGNRMSSKLMTDKTKSLGWVAKNNLPDYIKRSLDEQA